MLSGDAIVNHMWLITPGPSISARTFVSPGSMGQASRLRPVLSQLLTRAGRKSRATVSPLSAFAGTMLIRRSFL